VADKDIRILVEAIGDYPEWEKTIRANGVHRPVTRDSLLLIDFLRFIARKEMPWEEMFTLHTLKAFCDVSCFKHASRPLITPGRNIRFTYPAPLNRSPNWLSTSIPEANTLP